jgi:glycogen debranching enzyme
MRFPCRARIARAAAVMVGGAAWLLPMPARAASPAPNPVAETGLRLGRAVRPGAFYDVTGRRSALLGYEARGGAEVWAYPLQLVSDLRLAFRVVGYPLEFEGHDLVTEIEVRPEATTFTYSHAAFTVRQVLFAPLDEPAVVSLFEVRSALPLTIVGSFRPRLRLMWPAGLMTANVEWEQAGQRYVLGEESRRYAAVLGAPGLRDLALMPYQEEPRDVPLRFEFDVPTAALQGGQHLPLVIAGSVEGRAAAVATYERVRDSVPVLLARTAAHYAALTQARLQVETPDARLNAAFAWAKVGIDKGLVTNPLLGTGLVAGFRTAGESERPGFAWFFGRDALWTALAMTSYGDHEGVRQALDFLRRFQREDGEIPHEVSQSAALLRWFDDYPYAWNSADASALYVVAHADFHAASGDAAFLRAAWPSIVKAWRHVAASDTDDNGLVENTRFGHGWVEGGALYPPHEELYQQGVWMQACRGLAELAEVLGDTSLAQEARQRDARTRAAVEATYWLAPAGFYAFATLRAPDKPRTAEPGPERERRQRRMAVLDRAALADEDTVLPAVPLWFTQLDEARAQTQIDHLGAGTLATDWGQRLLAASSELYDPLSYHNGSVWPLFTGWASLAAYRYGRPHVGWQALMANALLTEPGALGYVTELLSGDFNAPFGRSSHHQVWSEAMVVTPLVRGLLGLEVTQAGRRLEIAPRLPADWPGAAARGLRVGAATVDVVLRRTPGRFAIDITSHGARLHEVALAPALPLDARVRRVTHAGKSLAFETRRAGDRQLVEARLHQSGDARVLIEFEEGSDVWWPVPAPAPGATSAGLRVLRSEAGRDALHLLVEGLPGRDYTLYLRTPRRPAAPAGVELTRVGPGEYRVSWRFDGTPERYARRALTLDLR